MSESYLTTPIYYINAQPHIGHAYTTMLTDAIARSRRLMGDHVFFLTGTDEHGQKVDRAAQKANLPTPQFADQVSAAFRQMCRDLKISNDDFIRTTEPRHFAAAQEIWRRVQRAGDIYKGEYEGWYCTVDEIFVPEAQLVDGKCPTCGSKVERLKEESYYFRLSKYEKPLLDYYRDHPDFIQPEFRLNEVRTFVEAGLQDLSISRTSFKWGIPVPDDPKHVMYVWFDALTNYLTALGFGSGDAAAEERLARLWPTVTHFIGKEIVRQHALYWPAFLMSAGLPVPRRIIAHGFWLMGGAKMSKSLGNVARYQDYTQIFGLDGLRYFVMREMPLGQDASFSDEAMLTRFNADLANDLGNLVSRAITMVHRYRDGRVPASPVDGRDTLDRDLVAATAATIESVKAWLWRDSGEPGAAGHVGPRPPRQQVHRRARAVGAREGRGQRRDARSDAVSRRRYAQGHCGARRSGDAGRGGPHSRNARHRQRRAVDVTPGGNACGRCTTATGRSAVPAHRKDHRGTTRHDDIQRIHSGSYGHGGDAGDPCDSCAGRTRCACTGD